MTLVELLVAMGIFVVVIAIFMGGVVSMTQTTARAQAVSDATSAARKVLDRFDKQVRYSSGINRPGPGVTAGTYYIEYVVPAQVSGTVQNCVQWRYDSTAHTLAIRSWPDTTTPAPTAWNTIATDVRNAIATEAPFVFTPSGVKSNNQSLQVTLNIGKASRSGAFVSTTYVARNTTINTGTNLQGADGLSNSPVCQTGIGRP